MGVGSLAGKASEWVCGICDDWAVCGRGGQGVPDARPIFLWRSAVQFV